jgi:hypothetical protein
MDSKHSPGKGKEISETTWKDTYKSALEFIRQTDTVTTVHIDGGVYFNTAYACFESDPEYFYKNANRITIFVRRVSGRITAGLELRLKGNIISNSSKRTNFHYREFKRHRPSPEKENEVVITKYLNTVKTKYLEKFMEELKDEGRRYFITCMENSALENMASAALSSVSSSSTDIPDDLPF